MSLTKQNIAFFFFLANEKDFGIQLASRKAKLIDEFTSSCSSNKHDSSLERKRHFCKVFLSYSHMEKYNTTLKELLRCSESVQQGELTHFRVYVRAVSGLANQKQVLSLVHPNLSASRCVDYHILITVYTK